MTKPQSKDGEETPEAPNGAVWGQSDRQLPRRIALAVSTASSPATGHCAS